MHGGNVWQGDSPTQWLDYSANIRPEGPPRWVRVALRSGMENVAYYPDPTMRRAREVLAQYLGLDADFVRPTAGGISAIDMTTHLGSAGMLLATPCFAEYAAQSGNRGKPVFRGSLLEKRHQIGNPADLLRGQLFRGCTVWLCNPLNPVGVAFSRAQVLELLEAVEAVDGYLAVDEAFIEYCPQHTARPLLAAHERLVITGSMTKVLGIPGVRLGYLCAQPQVLERIARYQLTWELNCFAEAVLCELARHAAEIEADARLNAARREGLRRGLEVMGAFVYPSEASFLLADFGRPVAPIEARLKEKGILVRSCMDFDGIDDGWHLRLAVKDEAANARLTDALREAMACVENR